MVPLCSVLVICLDSFICVSFVCVSFICFCNYCSFTWPHQWPLQSPTTGAIHSPWTAVGAPATTRGTHSTDQIPLNKFYSLRYDCDRIIGDEETLWTFMLNLEQDRTKVTDAPCGIIFHWKQPNRWPVASNFNGSTKKDAPVASSTTGSHQQRCSCSINFQWKPPTKMLL